MIERKIVTGLIVSTEFIRQIYHVFDTNLFESVTAKRLAMWCAVYYEKYLRAPGKDIEGIYFSKIRDNQISKEISEEIEEILSSLSGDYSRDGINVDYLVAESKKFFSSRRLVIHMNQLKELLSGGQIDEAEHIACQYRPLQGGSDTDLDFSSDEIYEKIDHAFSITKENVIKFPFALGEFWNDQFVRGGLVALLAPEKRGKTFMLIDIALRACRQKKKVAFFQAGDLTEVTFIKRVCIYLAQRSDRKKYCETHFQPVRDCFFNQTNDCTREERCCDSGVFEGVLRNDLKSVIIKDLIEKYEESPSYRPCTHCNDYKKNHWGSVWIKKIDQTDPLTPEEGKEYIKSFFVSEGKRFQLSTHPNNTLNIGKIRAHLEIWEKQSEFVPDLIVIDYADLLVPEVNREFRHQQNEIWKGLRQLSQEKGQPLVITATQSDAKSYDNNKLTLSNFSEDKRKYGHATAFYGLNQDKDGREKKIGIIRINELLLREDDFDVQREITILQNLRKGIPILESFWSI